MKRTRRIPRKDRNATQTAPRANVGAIARRCLAHAALPTVREAEAVIGGPVVIVVLDPRDRMTAALVPAVAQAYAAGTMLGSAMMVVASGGSSVHTVDGEDLSTLDDHDAGAKESPVADPIVNSAGGVA